MNEDFGLQLYSKETPTQVFSCGFCEIFKKTFLQKTFGQLLISKGGWIDLLNPIIVKRLVKFNHIFSA